MTDRYKRIRAALAMGPTPGPWLFCPTNSGTFVKSERLAGYFVEVRHCRTTQDVRADAHLIAACDPDTIRDLLAERDALAAEVERLRRGPHPAITHCDNCGCDWLDNGLNHVGCPYCELRRETERELKEWIERGRTEEEKAAALKWLEDMRGDSECLAGEGEQQ